MTVPRILAIDTTSEFGSLALVEGSSIVEEILLHSQDGFGHILFDQINQLLARHQWTYSNIHCYAAASGPGSFTGVRVGLSAAKGLAEAVGVPASAVSNLRAMAWHGSGTWRAPFLDARRGEIYGGVFDENLRETQPEMVAEFGNWLASVPQAATLYTPDPSMYQSVVHDRVILAAPRALAGAVGLLAWSLRKDPVEIDANYVRRSDAEMAWKEI